MKIPRRSLPLLLAAPLAAAPLPQAQVDASIRKVGAIEEVVRAARDELPRADLDLEERALALAMDADAILAWTRDEVRLDAYPGVLRGPRGALRARAGNAWDQALLAASLLRTSGYQARLARAELSAEQAGALLAGLGTARAGWEDPGEEVAESLGAELAELAGQDDAAREKARSTFEAQVAEGARALKEASAARQAEVEAALDAADFRFAADRGAWVEEARDYAWVQYRRAQGDPWVDAHPAFPGAPEDLAPTSWVEGSVPEDALFHLEVSLVLERAEKGRLRTEDLMSDWRRPVANLEGEAIQLSLSGDGFRKASDSADPEAGWARTRYFYPTMGPGLAPRARAFDLRGFVMSPDAAGHGMAKIFSTVGDRSLSALDALNAASGDDGPGAQELTAVWVDLTVTRPGGEEVRHRRYFLDRIGPAARAAGEAETIEPMEPLAMAAALHRQLELVVLTGDETPYAALDETLAFRADTLTDLSSTLRQLREVDPQRRVPRSFMDRQDPRALNQATGVGATPPPGEARSFRSGPGVFLFQRTLIAGGGTREQLDVVRTPRRAIRPEGQGWISAPEAVLAAGVRETVAERLRPHPKQTELVTSAAAQLAGADLQLVTDAAALEGLELPATARANLEADLGRGFVALLRPGPEPAWWRIDPSTGETTGVTADGAGSETADYLDVLSVVINVAFSGYGMTQCETSCCIITTAMMGTGLTIGGLAIGAALTGKGALAFMAIMDIGVNSATSAIVPPPCND